MIFKIIIKKSSSMRKTLVLFFFFLSIYATAWSQTNLLNNPGAESYYDGWIKTDGGSGWNIFAQNPHSGNNFWASSYEYCSLSQTVDLLLAGFTESELDASPDILTGAYVRADIYNGGTYTIKVELLTANGTVDSTIYISNNESIVEKTDWIYKPIVISSYGTGIRKISFTLIGKDQKWWGGQSGPAFDDTYIILSKVKMMITSADDIKITAPQGSNNHFEVMSNTSWSLADTCSWLDFSQTSGSGCLTVTTTANTANTTHKDRSATVIISGTGVATKSITITQYYKQMPIITWGTPSNIEGGTALTHSQLSASANIPGSISYNPAIGTILPVGNNQPLTLTFTPTDTMGYYTTTKTVYINVISTSNVVDASSEKPTVFYNPVTDVINIGGIGSIVSIFDMSGRLVLKKDITGNRFINVRSLSKGLYIVRANDLTARFIKK